MLTAPVTVWFGAVSSHNVLASAAILPSRKVAAEDDTDDPMLRPWEWEAQVDPDSGDVRGGCKLVFGVWHVVALVQVMCVNVRLLSDGVVSQSTACGVACRPTARSTYSAETA